MPHNARMKNWFSWVLLVGVVGLSVMVVLLARQNGRLRAAVEERDAAVAALASEGGLREGDQVGPLELFDADGTARVLGFDEGHASTLILLVSTGCEACDVAVPLWEQMLEEGGFGAMVVAVDASVREPSALGSYSERFPTWGTTAQRIGWLREIPLTPSAVLVGPGGRVLGAWYGVRAATRTGEILDAMTEAAAAVEG